MNPLSGDPRMALQADWHDKEDQKYPHWSSPKSPQKGLPRFRLLFLASHAILEAQQAKEAASRLWDGNLEAILLCDAEMSG